MSVAQTTALDPDSGTSAAARLSRAAGGASGSRPSGSWFSGHDWSGLAGLLVSRSGSSVPVAEPGVMMALGDQYLAMQGSAWRRTDVGLVELWLVKVLGSRSGRMMAVPALPGSAARRTRGWGSWKRRVRPPRGAVSRLRTGRA